MRRLATIVTIFAITFIACNSFAETVPATGTVSVFFSPSGGAEQALVQEINKARQEILIQAYSFTSKVIASAVTNAQKRGVKIIAVLDKSQRSEKYSAADYLANSGIETSIDAIHPIAHNKIFIIDRATLIGGSYNYSKAAETNAENLMIFHNNPPLVELYVVNFFNHKAHSEPYTSRGRGARNPITGLLSELVKTGE